MIKKLIFVFLLLTIVSVVFATENFPFRDNEFGLTFKYDPLAGTFGRTVDGWSYEQESVFVGMYGYLWLNDDVTLLVKTGIIPGSNDIGDKIGVVGASTNMSLCIGEIVELNYGCSYYWGGNDMPYVYDMCTGVVHRMSVQVYVPLSGQTNLQ